MSSIFDDQDSDEELMDENYKSEIYPRAAKDFIHIRDFKRIMRQLFEALNLSDVQIAAIDLESRVGALTKQRLYERELDE